MTERLFTFAIIADTHLNPVDGESGSPWRSNALANDRARWTVAALNADHPDIVLHLGDMVHPIPAQASYRAAAARFHSIFGQLDAPLHVLPGNHDIGDKPGDWMPAHPVTPDAMTGYREIFGDLWSAFDHAGCQFILHCNPILGSGLHEDQAQWEWLEGQLDAASGQRVFFLTHYPLFLTRADEPEHYDNLAFPARDRLRRLLVGHGVEAVFAAHVHNIFHTPLADCDAAPMQHVVPCVSAIRLDYSHLFRSPPGPEQEYGRNDVQKLGYYLVDVTDEGYRIQLRRTGGQGLAEATAGPDPKELLSYRQNIAARPLGVDLRHDWARPVAIPYSGVVDEFRRKYVRNDYLVAALQEAGIRDLRVPVDDLYDDETRVRMRTLARLGHRFLVFTIEAPNKILVQLLRDTRAVSAIEVIARPDRLQQHLADWRGALEDNGPPLIASRLWSSSDIKAEALNFSHGIGHGFFPNDTDLLGEVDAQADGAVIRIGPGDDPTTAIGAIPQTFAGQLVLYVSLTSPSPAHAANDDDAQKARAISAMYAASRLPMPVTVMFDTLEDHDRGYYPRHGFYDSQFNPRPLAIHFAQNDLPFPVS